MVSLSTAFSTGYRPQRYTNDEMRMHMAKLTGADYLAQTLLAHGATTVFGIPGGRILPLYDAMYRRRAQLRHVLTAHEQAAAHAADGWARALLLSGQRDAVGVCIATSGPGSTNLITGIATAYADSSPVVALCGNVPTRLVGTDSFQEADIVGMTMSITKSNRTVRAIDELPRTLDEAFTLARTGRPGPVLVDLPEDVLTARAEHLPAPNAAPTMPKPLPTPNAQALARAAEMIAAAKHPVIMAGGGAVRAGSNITRLAQALGAPMVFSLMGLSAVPASHPLNLGMAGLYGSREANAALEDCDLLIALGVRFSDRWGFRAEGTHPAERRIIHVDIDRAELGKNLDPHCYLHGDAGTVAALLTPANVRPRVDAPGLPASRTYAQPDSPESTRLIAALATALGPEAAIVTDVGAHQMAVARHYPFAQGDCLITSGGMGTMGFGLGAAIGACLARPGSPTALVTGDGSLRMSLGELGTVAALDLPLIIAVMDNHVLGMVRDLQTQHYGRRHYAVTSPGVDWPGIARSFGIHALHADNAESLASAVSSARGRGKPALIACNIP